MWGKPATGSLPVGQDAGSDLVAPTPLAPYGRLHKQTFNGEEHTHIDSFDPDRGLVYAAAHAAFDVAPFILSKVPIFGRLFSLKKVEP